MDRFSEISTLPFFVDDRLVHASGGDIIRLRSGYIEEALIMAQVEIGLATERIGTSSVVYRFAIFAAGDDTVRATGRFVHVYVDRDQRTPTAIPDRIRTIVSGLPRWESVTGVSA